MLLNDRQIRQLIAKGNVANTSMVQVKVLEVEGQEPIRQISYGVSSAGLDVRLKGPFLIPKKGVRLDPKMSPEQKRECWEELEVFSDRPGEEYIVLPPNTMALGCSVEWFNLPRNIAVVLLTKSTYAREGLLLNCTPLEPGWAGLVTLELTNGQPNELVVYVNEGIGQCLFFEIEPCSESYADKQGKYQHQTTTTLSIV